MISLTSIWKDKGMSVTTKKRLLSSLVFSIVSYGSECWVLTETDKRRIDSFELWCFRRLLWISWTKKITNESILMRMNCKQRLLTSITSRKVAFVGHVMRKQNFETQILMEQFMEREAEGDRKRDTRTTSKFEPSVRWCWSEDRICYRSL